MNTSKHLQSDPRVSTSLLLLRLGVGLVFFMWTLDKLMNPEHASSIFERYYRMEGLGTSLMIGLGVIQMAVVVAFVVGYLRKWSYAIIFLMHLVSTLSCYQQYLNPWEKPNLLFFAAWPMLAAIVTLWLLRDYDGKSLDMYFNTKADEASDRNDKLA